MGDSDFLSLKEAAEYLNVKYKTVYRLVRDGKLPAVKIGGIYRIHRKDLEAYVELQRVAPPRVSVSRCAVCGRPIVSDLSIGGYCQAEECEEPICFACWQWEHQRFCPAHQAARTPPEEASMPASAEIIRCGTCFRIIPSPDLAGGQCELDGCDAWICTDCWNKPDGHFCRKHKPSRDAKLLEAQRLLAAGKIPCLVTDLEARKREINFLSRFDYKVRRVGTLLHPATGRALRIQDWDRYHTEGDETERLLELLGVGYLDKELLVRIPINAWSRYTIPPSGRVPGLVLEARGFSHLDAHVQQGFDTRPATVEDLVARLQVWTEEAEAERGTHVVGLASTTGWDEGARKHIQGQGGKGGFFHEWLMPVLIDLETGEVIYNAWDERLAPLAPLFAPQLHEELVHTTMRRVEALLDDSVTDSLVASEVASRLGVQEDVVHQAFERLAHSKQFVVEDIQGFGKTLMRKEG